MLGRPVEVSVLVVDVRRIGRFLPPLLQAGRDINASRSLSYRRVIGKIQPLAERGEMGLSALPLISQIAGNLLG